MLYSYTGTDTEKTREKLNAAAAKAAGKTPIVRITDAHTVADLEAALAVGGIFDEKKVVVLDNVLGNEELRMIVTARLKELSDRDETTFIYESAPDAATRKLLEKNAGESERYDLAKVAKKENIFVLANYLQQGKKKELWVAYQREIAGGKAPEALHGILFYGAKQLVLRNAGDARARRLVAQLAELPHESRRAGFELEYALEHFLLSRT